MTLGSAMPVMAEETAAARAAAVNVNVSLQLKEKSITYKAGKKATMVLKISNEGDELKNITVQPEYSNSWVEWPFQEVDKKAHTKTIKKLAAKSSTEIEYTFTTREDVTDGRCRVNFVISGLPDGNDDIEYTVYPFTESAEAAADNTNTGGSGDYADSGVSYDGGSYGDSSDGGSAGDGSIPRVIVTGFTTKPKTVKAGDDFKLTIHLKNTSKKTAVSNMVLDFTASTEGADENTMSPAFLPTSGSNTVYVDSIAAGGTKDVSIDLSAKADLSQKPYSMEVAMKYEDGSANQYESSSSVSISVTQEARFEFGEITITPESIEAGNEANVMCSMYNLGRVKLYNVKVTFEGQGISANETFVGNVEPGATANIDGTVCGEESTTGDGLVKMIISYEDEAGEVTTYEEEIYIFVSESMGEEDWMAVDGEEMIEEGGGGTSILLWIGLGVLVAAIAVAAAVIIRKKKKANLEGDGLEDELDRLIEDE